MPVVPVSPGPRIPLQPLRIPQRSPNAPTEAFGGGIAADRGTLGNLQPAIQGAEAIGAEQARMAYQEKARADQIAVTDAASQIAGYRTHALYNPDKGWLNQQGKNAFDVPEKAQTEYWQVAQVMRNSLTNADQQAAFDKIAVSEWDQMNQQIQLHVAKQRVVYDNESTQAALDAKHDQAVKAYDDPMIVEPAITAQSAIIALHSQRNGLPDEFTKEQIAKQTSQTRFEVIQQFVDNHRDVEAQQYLAQHRDDLIGKQLTQAETMVHRVSVEGEAIRAADVITGMKPALEGGVVQPAKSEDEALREAAKIDDPQVREKTEQRISLFYNRKAAATRETQQSAFEQGYQILVRNGGDLARVPMSLRQTMGAMHDENLTAESVRLQKVRDPGDPEAFTTLMNQAYFNPDEFAQLDITSVPGLSTAQKTHLMTLQRSVGLRQERTDEGTIQKDLTRANADARFYKHKAETAAASGDKEGQSKAALQQYEAETEALRLQEELNRRRTAGPGHVAPAGSPVVPHSSTEPATVPGRSAPNPVGLTPLTKPTPQMLLDIAKHGPGYAAYLRHMGIDAPDSVVLPAPPKKP